MSLVEKISTIVEQMPQKKQVLILELVKTMVDADDVLSDEDIADIKKARLEFASDEYVKHGDINWN